MSENAISDTSLRPPLDITAGMRGKRNQITRLAYLVPLLIHAIFGSPNQGLRHMIEDDY